MGPVESRESRSLNRVRMFRKDKLDRSIMCQKWDIVKVICTQPYNKHLQYGLSFITFFRELDPTEKPKIGAFRVLAELDEDDDPVRIGSLFAKRVENSKRVTAESEEQVKQNGGTTLSTSAILRGLPMSPTSIASTAIISGTEKVRQLLSLPNLGTRENMSKSSSTTAEEHVDNEGSFRNSQRVSSSAQLPNNTNCLPQKTNQSIPKGTHTAGQTNPSATSSHNHSSSSSPSTSSKKSPANSRDSGIKAKKPKTKKTKPFNQLFGDVTFVISGFENPHRSELRRKGLKMGGKCKPDWDSSCTHLLCAFVNTPKFRQVKSSGRGNIVSKKWVEDSYRKRCRLPWRRYCLDRNDQGPESEDEIFAKDSGDTDVEESQEHKEQPDPANLVITGTPVVSSKIDSDEQNQSNEEAELELRKKRKRVLVVSSSDEEMPDDNRVDALYNVDTDVDEDVNNQSSREPNPDPHDGTVFSSTVFCLDSAWSCGSQDEKNKIGRTIIRNKGTLVSALTDNVEFLVTEQKEWSEEFSEALSENPNLTIVSYRWISECEKKNEMISPDLFMILPN